MSRVGAVGSATTGNSNSANTSQSQAWADAPAPFEPPAEAQKSFVPGRAPAPRFQRSTALPFMSTEEFKRIAASNNSLIMQGYDGAAKGMDKDGSLAAALTQFADDQDKVAKAAESGDPEEVAEVVRILQDDISAIDAAAVKAKLPDFSPVLQGKIRAVNLANEMLGFGDSQSPAQPSG